MLSADRVLTDIPFCFAASQDQVQKEMWSKGPADRSGLTLSYDFSPDNLKEVDSLQVRV